MLSNCVAQGPGGDTQPGLYTEFFSRKINGGIHSGMESFTFADGHGAMYKTEPISSYFRDVYAYTYPPGRNPGQAQWWTMPYYPNAYPYRYGNLLR